MISLFCGVFVDVVVADLKLPIDKQGAVGMLKRSKFLNLVI